MKLSPKQLEIIERGKEIRRMRQAQGRSSSLSAADSRVRKNAMVDEERHARKYKVTVDDLAAYEIHSPACGSVLIGSDWEK